MRNAVLLFAGTFAAVLLGLLLNDYLAGRRQDELLDKVHAESEATRHQLDRLSKDQEQIKRTLSQAGDSLASAQDKDSMLIRADFSAAAASMRTAIAEYYMSTAKMPSGNNEVGLPAPDQYRGQSLVSATVAADGSIDFLFDAKSGVDGGRIRLIPDISRADAMGIQWRCETRDYALIKRALPSCEYLSADEHVATPALHNTPTGD